jgi:hypothetical protein
VQPPRTEVIVMAMLQDAEPYSFDDPPPFSFEHPFNAIVNGPTGSGKTELVKKIIQNIDELMEPPPDRIVWYYGEYQPALESALGHLVDFREGCPTMSDFEVAGGDQEGPTLVIIDDLMAECNEEVAKMFTKGSHHRGLSIFFLTQNLFHKAKGIRDMSLNAQYFILFKNPRDSQQVKTLARQMYGQDAAAMEQAYEMATKRPHGYLLLDIKQDTTDPVRWRSKILPGELVEVIANKRTFKDNFIVVYKKLKRKRLVRKHLGFAR